MPTRLQCNSGTKGKHSRGWWFCERRPRAVALLDQRLLDSGHNLLQVRTILPSDDPTTLFHRDAHRQLPYLLFGAMLLVVSCLIVEISSDFSACSLVAVATTRYSWSTLKYINPKPYAGHASTPPLSDASATPPPTQYLRKDSFDDIVEKWARLKSKPFSSTSDRREGGAFELKETENIPGPGAYNIAVAKQAAPPPRSRAHTRSRLPQGARFGTTGSQSAVGPGSHEIGGSLIKKTFNITFGGACTPAGTGRMVHRALHAQKIGESSKFLDEVPSVSAPGGSSFSKPLNTKESLRSPRSAHVPVTA